MLIEVTLDFIILLAHRKVQQTRTSIKEKCSETTQNISYIFFIKKTQFNQKINRKQKYLNRI